MATNLIMPSLGFDMTEGKVAGWRKAEGDRVVKGEPVFEVETEKATVEVESPSAGILVRILVPPGTTVPVGTVVGVVAEAGEATAAPGAAGISTGGRADMTGSNVAGTSPLSAPLPTVVEKGGAGRPEGGEERIKASPLARRIALDAGIDLSKLRGTGTDGRVTERDVQGAVDARKAVPSSPASPETTGAPPQPAAKAVDASAPSPLPESAKEGSVPLSRMRRVIARRMAESKASAPHFYVGVEINAEEAMKVRRESKAGAPGEEPLSMNDLIVAAVARTLPRFPLINASWRDDTIVMHSRVSIGIAVALDEGLVVPVLHDAELKSLPEIARESRELIARARAGKLRPEDLGPATFSISNLSAYGVDEFTAIINPPEAAILAVGAVVRRPVAVKEEVRIVPVIRVTLSVDHRVADGAVASRFLQELRHLLEKPAPLLSA